jgi:hypothetical protein
MVKVRVKVRVALLRSKSFAGFVQWLLPQARSE